MSDKQHWDSSWASNVGIPNIFVIKQQMFQSQKTLKALEAKAQGKKVVGKLLLDDESLLTPKVMVVDLPPKYVVMALVYGGKIDPNHHVERFNKITRIKGLNDL